MGKKRLLASAGELQKGNEMVLPQKLSTLLYHAHRINNLNEPKHLEYVKAHKEDFNLLLSYIEVFAYNYIDAEKNVSKIQAAAERINDFPIEEIASSFINLLGLTALGAPADFTFLDAKIPRKRYTSTTECLNATLIHQSITGLYETRIDLSQLGDV